MDPALRADLLSFLTDVAEGCPGEDGDCPNIPCHARDARELLGRLAKEA